MFADSYQVVGMDSAVKLKLKHVIFVMEDVDAISKVVHRREDATTESGKDDEFAKEAGQGGNNAESKDHEDGPEKNEASEGKGEVENTEASKGETNNDDAPEGCEEGPNQVNENSEEISLETQALAKLMK